MTTPVGSISLGLSIDGSGLPAEILAQIRGALDPVLTDLRRGLDEVQQRYRQVTHEAERSADRQVLANRRVAHSLREVRDAALQARAAMAGSNGLGGGPGGSGGGGNSTVINNDRRAFDYRSYAVTNNYNQNTYHNTNYDYRNYGVTNNHYDYSTTTINNPPGPGGGGGGGGGSGGRRGGALGFLTSPLGLNAIAIGAQALPAVATGVTNIVGAVQQLAQAGGVLPGIFAGGAAAIGTAVVGFKGMGDAVKALNEAAASGDAADLEKAAEALKDMDPAAVAVAKSVSKLTQGPLKDLKKSVQANMFEGVAADLDEFAGRAIPRAEAGMSSVGKAWNNTLKTVLAEGGSDKSLSLMDRIFGNTAEGQNRANAAIKPMLSAVGQLSAVGSDFLPRLGDGLAKVATRLDNFISKNNDNGNLWRWIDEGLNGVRAFGNALLNVGKTITGLTKATGALQGSLSGDGGFLGWLERATGQMETFVNSADGQSKLTEFFRGGREDMANWGHVLADLGPVLRQVLDGFQTWGELLFPIIKAVGNLLNGLSQMPGVLESVVVGFLAFKTISGIVGGVTTSVGALGGALGKLKLAAGVGGLAGLLGFSSAQQDATTTGGQLGSALGVIGSGALLGGAIGSVVPGVGTALGAGVGAGVGTVIAGFNVLLGENARQSKLATDAAEAFAAQQERLAEATSAAQAAMKNLNTALLDSGGKFDASSISAIQDRLAQLPDVLSGQVNEDTVKGVQDAIKNLGLDQKQLATVISAGGPVLDALLTNLRNMGPAGGLAATAISQLSGSVAAAQQVAQGANPILTQLAQTMGSTLGTDLSQIAEGVRTVFDSVPENVPLSFDMPNVQGALDILTNVGAKIGEINGKPVILNANDQAVKDAIAQLHILGIDITTLPQGNIIVNLDQGALNAAKGQMDSFMQQYSRLLVQPTIAPGTPGATQLPTVGGVPFPGRPAGADGMVIPGYAPGLDIVNAVLAPGEGVLIPEAVRGLGGPAGVYALNSRFRSGLSKRYYADGGVHAGTGALPGPGDDATELGVLRQIRDLLAGKGGTSAPLNQTASAVSSIADMNKTGGQELGPFGTPIKPRHRGYEMAAAAISALGGDPEKWLGADPATLPVTQGGLLPVLAGAGGLGGGTANVAALQKFAQSGNIADLAGTGLDVNDSVVKAIVTARNKKKGALGTDAISDLIGQTFGPGGYTGSVTSSNSALLSALQSYQEKLAKGAGSASSRGGYASVAALTGVPMTGLPGAGPKGSKAGLQPNAAQLWDVIAAQFPEVREIGGVRNDPIPDHPSGRALDIMVGQNQELGDRINEYLRANATALGLDSTIWRDKWADFAGNTSTVGGHQDHIHAKVAEGAATGLAGLQIPGTAPFQAGLSGGGGTPVFVTNWPGGQGIPGLGGIVGAGLSAGGGVAGTVTGDVMSAVAGLGQEPWNKAANYASLNQLVRERNPLALAKAFGLDVPDFTRQGGDGADVMKNDQAFDSSGRLFSDTGALLDRTFTNLNAQLAAMREQLVSVIEQTNQKLNEEALEPVVKAGVQNALEGLKDSVSGAIGTALGQAAAPPIADAVRSAMPAQNGTSLPADAANGFKAATGMATGGGVFGGVPGRDSVPAMLMPGEHVLTTTDVARMGGHGGVYAFRAALARNGGMRGYATGGGVNVNDTVGAEFFGVSQIPIIGAIVNILVRVLLSVLGVQIEARDTLGEMTDQFRQFRGEFKAFDASGRLLNDTSALMDRSQSSEEIAAQERIRILKIVIEALIKYIIEKVIVPITKAVANAAIQAGASAAGAAVNSQAPGAGGIVSSLISSAGSAGVDIAAEVGTDLALAISSVAIDAIAEGLQSLFPDLVGGIFGGGIIEQLIAAPITAALEVPLAIIGALTGGLTSLFAPLLAIIGGGTFDSGGVAHGVGLMPKATIRPERVLSPQQTASFDRLVAWLDRNQGSGGPGSQTIVQIGEGAIQVAGGPEAGRNVASGLMELMS